LLAQPLYPEKERPVHVEIWSDIACPWCYVGKRRFEAALAGFEHRDDVRVTWRSFELDPSAPREREGDGAQHLADKYGTTRDEALAMQQRVADVAAGEGLDFRFDVARGGNTFDGHRLLHLAAAHGVQDAMKERLMRAYLGEGELIGDAAVLERLALEVGLPADEVRDVVGGDRYAAQVRDDERTAAALGIRAVPFFVVDRRIGASGAHPPAALLDLLRQAWPAEPALEVVADGASCGVEGC
jgi:predicted DsbA family dithiol-disulfide isomerase